VGAGGAGGGGNGSFGSPGTGGTAGTANTGGGGGGGQNGNGYAGGSGIVVIRYLTVDFGTCTGGTITTDGAYTVHTFTSSGTFTPAAPTPGYALVSSVGGTGTTSAIDTSGADLLVAYMSYDSGATFSDSKGNTWTALTARSHNGSDSFGRFYYVENPTVGTGHTFSSSQSFASVFVQAWYGSLSPTAYDQETGSTASSTTSQQPGSLTPTEDNSLLVFAVANGGNASAHSVNSGFTISNTVTAVTGLRYGGSMAYKVQGTKAAENPTYSWTGSTTVAAAQVIFKPAGGAPPPSFTPTPMIHMMFRSGML
jgi:hypothetical protein